MLKVGSLIVWVDLLVPISEQPTLPTEHGNKESYLFYYFRLVIVAEESRKI